jgi:hypothetical protein
MDRPGRMAVAAVMALSIVAVSSCSSPPASQQLPAAEDLDLDGPLSALAPANLAKPRPAPPFNLTGNWFVDTSDGPESWRFGPPWPKFTPAAQVHVDASINATAEGKIYRDDIGQCWPAGMPLIMTRFWPMAMIQLPTAIYMVSGFMNSLRIVYLDGRSHTDEEIVVRTHNGESVGRWEGDTLVVETTNFRGDHHWMDQGGLAVPAGEHLHITERIRMISEGNQLEIEFIMIDPEHWEGEWRVTKRFNRVDDIDIQEVVCLPDLNQHLQSTTAGVQIR